LVNSSGGAHARNARRLVHATKKQDRRLSAALLAAALAHTPEAQQVLDGARMRLGRKPSALARELLRNFPKGKRKRAGRRRKKGGGGGGGQGDQQPKNAAANAKSGEAQDAKTEAVSNGGSPDGGGPAGGAEKSDAPAKKPRSRRRRPAKKPKQDPAPEKAAEGSSSD
jgi:hypothetical protein